MATADTQPRPAIRLARADDAPALREIYNEAVEDGFATFQTPPRSVEEQRQLIFAAERDPRHPILLAEVRNWVCGFAAIEPHDDRHGLEDIGEVVVFVHRSFRSYGVGRQLMRLVQEKGAQLGYRKLVGRVLADNQESLRLCQATGWRIVGSHEQHARHGAGLRDVVIVEHLVSPLP